MERGIPSVLLGALVCVFFGLGSTDSSALLLSRVGAMLASVPPL